MKFWRDIPLLDGYTADPRDIQRDLTRGAGVWNGNIDGLDLDANLVTGSKIPTGDVNEYEIERLTPPLLLQRDDVTPRDWTKLSSFDRTWTAEDEGVVIGNLDLPLLVWGQAATDVMYGASVGVFLDDLLIAETDLFFPSTMTICLPFMSTVAKGGHTFGVGVRLTAYDVSLGPDPDDVAIVGISNLWWRLAKR